MKVYVLLEIGYDWHNIVGVYKDIDVAKLIKKEKEENEEKLYQLFDTDKNEFIIEESELI